MAYGVDEGLLASFSSLSSFYILVEYFLGVMHSNMAMGMGTVGLCPLHGTLLAHTEMSQKAHSCYSIMCP